MTRKLQALRNLLGKQFGIPRSATVDPTLFPETDYPVVCLDCGYDLRGIADGRCPECGREFDRGRLLVERYALCRLPRRDKFNRFLRLLTLLEIGIWLCFVLLWLGVWIVATFMRERAVKFILDTQWDPRPWFLVAVIAVAIAVTAGVVSLILFTVKLPPRAKRRAVREAAARAR